MSASTESEKQSRSAYRKHAEAAADEVVAALCETYKNVTGRVATGRMRDEFFSAVRFDL